MLSQTSKRLPQTLAKSGTHVAVERLAIIMGDQLNDDAPLLGKLDKSRDAVLMMEVEEESTHVPSHKQRIVLFLSAMRHFATHLANKGYRMHYVQLEDSSNTQSFTSEIERAVKQLRPNRVLYTHPGEWRVKKTIDEAAQAVRVPVEVHADHHFLVSLSEFGDWMTGRKQPVMEHFYRAQRRRLGVLMQNNGQPEGDTWNFDPMNRQAFKDQPHIKKPYSPKPDAMTKDVIRLVNERFPHHPGSLETFCWPVTRTQALRALKDFVANRLANFGAYQDAMWTNEPFLYHSALSTSLNLKLLAPLECVVQATKAYQNGQAPLNSVEGFVRQIIGWREFIHGIYWHEGPTYRDRNSLNQHGMLPDFYWTGQTDMTCMRQAIGQVLSYGYGHHIQRLMVTGNFALIAGVSPQLISDWYLGMYVDAVDWVTLPNTLGMVMHADNGLVGSKPYAASGKYIQRMSNYCSNCPYDPGLRTGQQACPFTTFYWDFLMQNRKRLQHNLRMRMALRNLDRISKKELSAISAQADHRRQEFGI